MKKIIAGLLLMCSMSVNALNIDYDEPKLTAEPYKTKSFRYVGENELIKIYINPEMVYNVRANFFEKIRIAPVRLDLKLDQNEMNKAGYTYINFTFVDCINKKNMTAFVHTYDAQGTFLREELNQEADWQLTEPESNSRILLEYVCTL